MQYVIINDEVWSADTEVECDAAAAELARIGQGDTPVWSGTGEGPDDVKTGRMLVPRAAVADASDARPLYAIQFREGSDDEMYSPADFWCQHHDYAGFVEGGIYDGWVIAPIADTDTLDNDEDVIGYADFVEGEGDPDQVGTSVRAASGSVAFEGRIECVPSPSHRRGAVAE